MMKQFNHKKLIACLLVVVLSVSLLAVPASAAGTTNVEYKVSYNQSSARNLLTEINTYRTGGSAWYFKNETNERVEPTLVALEYDYDLEALAMTRAAEMVLCNASTRPNGDPFTSVGSGVIGEVRTRGATTANTACSAWIGGEDGNYASQGDRRALLSSSYTRIGASCVTVDSKIYWVVVFGSGTAGGTDGGAFSGEKTVTVTIQDSKVTGVGSYEANPKALDVTVGGTPVAVPTEVTAEITTATGGATVVVKNPTWVSTNTEFLTISGGQVTGKKARETSIQATLFGEYPVTANVKITCNHTPDSAGTQVTKQPTCGTAGKQTFTCSICKEKQVDAPIAKLPHTPKHYTAKAATCTEDGYKEHWRCTVCNGYFTDAGCTTATTKAAVTLTKLGHVEAVNPAVTVSCTVDGKTEGTYCTRCNEELVKQVITPALGHEWKIDEAIAVTCTKDGYTEGKHCVRPGCGETELQEKIPALNHKNKEAIKAVAPTCTQAGNIAYWHCPDCGKYFSDEACTTEIKKEDTVDKATGHQIVDDSKPATCTSSGISGASHCNVCNVVLSKGTPVSALGHDITELPAVEATCTTTGLTAGATCSRCSYEIEQKVVGRIDHDYQKVEGKAPTCSAAGYEAYYQCKNCPNLYGKVTLPATGHTFTVDVAAKAPTCTEDGYTAHKKCKDCTAVSGMTAVPATGHTPVPVDYVPCDGWNPAYGSGSQWCSVCQTVTTPGTTYTQSKMTWAASATVSGTTVKLKWNSAAGLCDCRGYFVYRYTTSDHSDPGVLVKKITSAKTTSCSITGNTPGTTVYYTVRARNAVGEECLMFADLQTVNIPLSTPSVTMKKTNGCTITVSWKAVKGAASYKVVLTDEILGTKTETTTDLSKAFTVNPKGVYTAYVVAINSDGTIVSANSATKKLTLSYSNPTMTLKSSGMNEIKISWKAVSGATSYKLYASTAKDGTYTEIYDGDGTEYSYKAAPGNTYYFKIRTFSDKGGRSTSTDYSAVKSIKLTMATPTITLKQTGNKEVTISWNKLNGATSYQLYRCDTSRGTYTLIADTADTSYVDTDVSLKETWYYKLRVVCVVNSSIGYSNYSSVRSIKLSEVEHEMDTIIKSFTETDYSDGFALCKCSLCGKQVMMWTTDARIESGSKESLIKRALRANSAASDALRNDMDFTDCKNDIDKVKVIYQWFNKNAAPLADEYCTSSYYAYNFGNEAFGLFFRGEASSSGYCKAAEMMFKTLGLECEHVNKDRYVHQYMRVKCDGKWYIFDPNEPGTKKGGYTGGFFNASTGIVPATFFS